MGPIVAGLKLILLFSLVRIGTAGLAVQVVGSNWPKPHYTLLITGLCRFRVTQLLKERPFPVGEVEQLDKLEQYASADAVDTVYSDADGELGELSQRFYQAAEQVCAHVVCARGAGWSYQVNVSSGDV